MHTCTCMCHMTHTRPQVVVDQDVLLKASAELTFAEASSIAENTLQYSVRSILWALQAPELLKASDGERVGALVHTRCWGRSKAPGGVRACVGVCVCGWVRWVCVACVWACGHCVWVLRACGRCVCCQALWCTCCPDQSC